MDTSARPITGQAESFPVLNATASATPALTPATAIKPHCRLLTEGLADSSMLASPASGTAFMPIECKADSRSAARTVCDTVSLRCIRLKSRDWTPGMCCSLSRIRPSSVGQSMFSIR